MHKFEESYQQARDAFDQATAALEAEVTQQLETVAGIDSRIQELDLDRDSALETGDMATAEKLTQEMGQTRERLSLETERLRILRQRTSDNYPDEVQAYADAVARIRTEETLPAIEKAKQKALRAVAAAQKAIDELREMVGADSRVSQSTRQLMVNAGLDHGTFPKAPHGYNPSDFELRLDTSVHPDPPVHIPPKKVDLSVIYGPNFDKPEQTEVIHVGGIPMQVMEKDPLNV